MEKATGKIKVSFVYYLSITTLLLLLATIFFTIHHATDKQKIRSNAATQPESSFISPTKEILPSTIPTPTIYVKN